jgi:hypothetical protein
LAAAPQLEARDVQLELIECEDFTHLITAQFPVICDDVSQLYTA